MKIYKDIINVDVGIVGGGVAGCYTGYRLTDPDMGLKSSSILASFKKERSIRIGLFEKTSRIGGRLKSVDCGKSFAELGGMRFTTPTPLLSELLEHAGLSMYIKEFIMDMPENICFLHGQRIDQKNIISIFKGGLLSCWKDAKTIEDVMDIMVSCVFPQFNELRKHYHRYLQEENFFSADQLQKEYESLKQGLHFNGKSLKDISWYNLLEIYFSPEIAHLLQDIGGYEIKDSNGNAMCWLDNIFYIPDNKPLECLSTGFETLPLWLHESFQDNAGETFLEHHLINISKFEEGYLLEFENKGKVIKVNASVVILTIPKPALQQLLKDNFFVQKIDRQGFNSIKSVDAFKLFLTYPYPWWQSSGLTQGRSTTDLPFRQCYYLSPATIMAVYCNGTDVLYWQELINQNRQDGNSPAEEQMLIDKALMQTAHNLLMTAHGVANAPEPERIFYKLWSGAAGEPGWHVWKEGVNPDRVIHSMRHPIKGEFIFIGGEGWSVMPGSVAGALLSSEAILSDELGLTRPVWMKSK